MVLRVRAPAIAYPFVANTTWDFTGGSLPTGATASGGANGTRVNSSGNIVAASAARFDYTSAGVARGVIVEAAATNIVLQSSNLANAAWTALGGGIASNAGISPSGSNDAFSIAPSSTQSLVQIYQSISVPASSGWVWSIYMHAGTTNWGWLNPVDGGNHYTYFDLANGVVGTIGSGVAFASITPVGGGWYRCSARLASTSGGSSYTAFGPCDADASTSCSTSKSVLLWGPQTEQNTALSSYIPTTSATVTRTADAISITVPSGAATLRFIFDDNTDQFVSVSSGAYTIPTNLNRARILNVAANDTGGGGTTQHLAAGATAVSTGTAELAGPVTVAARWNPSDASGNAVITNGGLSLSEATINGFSRSNQYESSGQKYVEFVASGTSSRYTVGLANASETVTNSPGQTANSIGVFSLNGQIKLNNTLVATMASAFGLGDKLGIYVDFTMGKCWFFLNNVQSGSTGTPGVSGGLSIPTGALALHGLNQITNGSTLDILATTTYTPQPGFTGFGNGVATTQHLAATAAAVATGTAETRVKYHLAATAASVATATADVRRSFHIIASAAALSTATANLDVQAGGTDHLAANATSVKTATAALRVTHHLAAGAAATCSASAFLIAGAIDIFANARVVASGSGTLSKFWTDISDAPEIWTDIR